MPFRPGVSNAQPMRIALWLRRRKRRSIVAFVFILTGLLAATARHLKQNDHPQYGDRLFVTVSRVVDERTFEVCCAEDASRRYQVRLDGLVPLPVTSAPEARRSLETRVGQTLTLYVRRVFSSPALICADAYPRNEPLLSNTLLIQGLARADAASAHPLLERFLILQRTAQQKRLGHWAHAFIEQEPTRNPSRMHPDGSRHQTASSPAPDRNPATESAAAPSPGTLPAEGATAK